MAAVVLRLNAGRRSEPVRTSFYCISGGTALRPKEMPPTPCEYNTFGDGRNCGAKSLSLQCASLFKGLADRDAAIHCW